jgi:hypothetical protein
MDGHGCSAPAEYSNEMIFEGLNGFFWPCCAGGHLGGLVDMSCPMPLWPPCKIPMPDCQGFGVLG